MKQITYVIKENKKTKRIAEIGVGSILLVGLQRVVDILNINVFQQIQCYRYLC